MDTWNLLLNSETPRKIPTNRLIGQVWRKIDNKKLTLILFFNSNPVIMHTYAQILSLNHKYNKSGNSAPHPSDRKTGFLVCIHWSVGKNVLDRRKNLTEWAIIVSRHLARVWTPILSGKIVLSANDAESSGLEDYDLGHVFHCCFLDLQLRVSGVECHCD